MTTPAPITIDWSMRGAADAAFRDVLGHTAGSQGHRGEWDHQVLRA